VRSDRLRLMDILDAITVIGAYLPADRSKFDSDPPVQSHVYRHIVIIGEASFKLSSDLKRRNPQVPWPLIEGMRHILVHDYFKVNWSRVYETARDHVPRLRPQIEAILAALPPDPATP
jgi:uncharacterized protein with HEPN domain